MAAAARRLSALSLATALAAAAVPPAPPSIIGAWAAPPAQLPHPQLPHVPLVGNGRVGLLLDAHAPANSPAAGPGRKHSTDLWLGSNSFWSCGNCGGGLAPGCCRLASVGGLTVSLLPSFPAAGAALSFSASQALGPALLGSLWTTPANGTLRTTTRMHPSLNLATTELLWSPGAGDPPELLLNVSVWAPSGLGRPASVGCAAGSPAAPAPCDASGAASQTIFVSRSAVANRSASPLPIAAGLAAAVTALAGGARVAAFSVTADAPGQLWEATASLLLPSGAAATVTLSELELRPAAAGADPALAAADAIAAGPAPDGIAAAAAAWWARYWQSSGVSTPARPELEQLWYGAQYALAGTASDEASVPGPGLYGVWSTSDNSNWKRVTEWIRSRSPRPCNRTHPKSLRHPYIQPNTRAAAILP